MTDTGGDGWTFGGRLLAVVLTIVAVAAVWYLRDLLLLVFASILVACVLVSATRGVSWLTGLGYSLSFFIAFVAIFALAAGFVTLIGSQLRDQFGQLWSQIPELIEPLERWTGLEDVEAWLAERAEIMLERTSIVNRLAGLSSAIGGMIANLLLVIVAGAYFAFRPRLYVGGFVRLFPPKMRGRADEALASIGRGLQFWLAGQLAAMAIVGLLTYTGLALLGVESALALAVIAAAFEFIPYLGPVLAAVPALVLAIAEGPQQVLWVGLLYLLVQQLEGNLVTPIVQQQSVRLAPAVTLFSILAFGILFGWLGILLATPLAVAAMFAIRELWIVEVLDEDPDRPASRPAQDGARRETAARRLSRNFGMMAGFFPDSRKKERKAMPAKSKAQQKAAGAALAAKRGDMKKSELKGASKSMEKSMSEKELHDMASTSRKGKPEHKSKS